MIIIDDKKQISKYQNKYCTDDQVIIIKITKTQILDYFNNDLSFYLKRVSDNILPPGITKIEVISDDKFIVLYAPTIISINKAIEFIETLDL